MVKVVCECYVCEVEEVVKVEVEVDEVLIVEEVVF